MGLATLLATFDKRITDGQRYTLIPVDEELAFSYAMRKDGGLQDDIGLLVWA